MFIYWFLLLVAMQKGSLYPTVFFLSLLLMLTLSANGQMLEVYPEEITLELTGGCSVTKEIYVNFLGTED